MLNDPFIASPDSPRLQAQGFEIELERRRVADLILPTGQIVACDPLSHPESEPFDVTVEPGTYPVSLMFAHMRDQRRVAFLSVEFAPERATRWQIASVAGDTPPSWKDARRDGFSVDSGVACIMDAAMSDDVLDLLHSDEGEEEISRVIHRNLSKARRGTGIAVAELAFNASANMIAFEVDDAVYTTYFGSTPTGRLARIVIDFGELDIEFTPYGIRHL